MSKVLSAWQRRYEVFAGSYMWRMKNRDTQARILDRENAERLAVPCAGTVIDIDGVIAIRFQGLREIEYCFEGEYLVRVVMPGDEYYAAMPVDKFELAFEKVKRSQVSRRTIR